VIFIDSNIPMYLVGSSHAHKADAQRLLEKCALDRERLVTDAEVFQEILHWYVAIRRRDAIQPAFDALLAIADDVFPVDLPLVERAKTIVLGNEQLSSRDALHLAVMRREGVERILSFDRGFDGFPGVERIGA
jgi:predicted nucleic acid-binding protein